MQGQLLAHALRHASYATKLLVRREALVSEFSSAGNILTLEARDQSFSLQRAEMQVAAQNNPERDIQNLVVATKGGCISS